MTRSLFDPARAIRGGSWFSWAQSARVVYRLSNVTSIQDDILGFRLLRRAA